MKKAILSIALALVLAATLATVFPGANAAETTHSSHCICGGNCTAATAENGHTCEAVSDWKPLTTACFTSKKFSGDKDVKDATYYYLKPGNYYLTADFNLTRTYYILPNTTVNICLNGHRLADTARLFYVNGSLNISDCAGGGSLYESNTTASYGLMYLYSGGTVTLYGGKIHQAENAGYDPADNLSGRPFGVIVVGNNDEGCYRQKGVPGGFTMYGGELIGTTVAPGNVGGKSSGGNGSAIECFHTCSTVSLYGGKITGVSAENGGVIHMGGGDLTVVNMTIEGGTATANGGTIYMGSGTAVIKNSTVTGGNAGNGGNIFGSTASTVNIENSTISGGTAKEGGNICVYGTLNLVKSTVSRGEVTGKGGNILVYQQGNCLIRESTVTDGDAKTGGNLCIGSGDTDKTAHAVMVIQNSEILNGLGRARGGNLFMYNSSDVIIQNTDILRGIAIIAGGNIFDGTNTAYNEAVAADSGKAWGMTAPELTLDGCTVRKGVSMGACNASTGNGKVTLKGDLLMDDFNYTTSRNLRLGITTEMDFSGLTSGAGVGISGAREEALQTGLPYSTKQLVQYDLRSYYVTVEEGGALYTRPFDTHYHCLCGGADPNHDHADVPFEPWDGVTAPETGHRYYLTGDVKKTNSKQIYTFNGQQIELCLDGHTMTNTSGRMIQMNSGTALTVCDDTGKGTIGAKGVASANGGVINAAADTTLTLYGVTLYRTDAAAATRTVPAKGGILYSNGTVNLCGTTLKDGHSQYGGNVLVENGALNISGDTSVLNGYCTKGGSADGIALIDSKLDLSGNLLLDSKDPTDMCLKNTETTVHDLTTKDTFMVSTGEGAETIGVDKDYTGTLLPRSAAFALTYYPEESVMRVGKACAAVCTGGEENAKYLTVQEAAAQCDENSFVRLLANVAQDVKCTKDLYLDTNGFTMAGTLDMGDSTLYGMDSKTNEYTDDAVGAVISEIAGNVATNSRLTKEMTGNPVRYAAIPVYDTDGTTVLSYSFHRFYMGMTDMTLDPETVSVGYKAAFAGDQAVWKYLDAEKAIGFQVWVKTADGDEFSPITERQTRDRLEPGKNLCTLWIRNMMQEGDDYRNKMASEVTVLAKAYVCLGGETVECETYSYTLQSMLETANDLYGTAQDPYTAAEKQQLLDICTAYSDYMDGWKLANILAYEA